MQHMQPREAEGGSYRPCKNCTSGCDEKKDQCTFIEKYIFFQLRGPTRKRYTCT